MIISRDKDQNAEFEHIDEDVLEADQVLEEAQLTLADEDDRLPWLESDDQDDDEGLNSGFIAMVAFGGVAVIALVLGAIWWLGRADTGGDLPADGSTIAAPAEPYKSRPDDAGGAQVAGTGDLSFEAGEGETRESQIASAPAAPASGSDAAAQPGFTDVGGNPAAAGGIGVQVGAYSTREQAQTGWNTLRQRFEALSGLNNRILEAQVDGATVYRLQAVTGDAATARNVCNAIKAGGGDCQVKN